MNRIFSYQYTFLRAKIYGLMLKVLQIALTDISNERHYFIQRTFFFKRRIFKDDKTIDLSPYSVLKRENEGLSLYVDTEQFSLELKLDRGKGGVWHGENGVLIMGVEKDPKQRTVYYSYTNMPTEGKLMLKSSVDKKTYDVSGKSWFDRQWGPFSITDPATHWEWFSLRFFDDEEVMLFSFPQHPYQDGTYVDREGNSRRIRNFKIEEKELKEVNGYVFSYGWNVYLPGVKEEFYEIIPMFEGQINIGYLELMAKVINPDGEHVGYAFVELLPGVRSKKRKPSIKNLIKKS